jgi:hypothetical protein
MSLIVCCAYVTSEGYIWYYIIEKYGNMISPETWTLIGVAVGATLGFIFTLFRDYIQEQSQKKKYFGCLLADLKYNKNLAEKGENWGYSLGSMERSKYLLDLSPELRNHIYDIQSTILRFSQNQIGSNHWPSGLASNEAEKLKKILDVIIPELESYLNQKKD